MSNNNFLIYIVHYDILVDRKINLIKQFNENNISENKYIFITNYKRDNISLTDLQLFENNSVSPGSIAITLSHLSCYSRLVSNNDKYCLIFEDDVIFNNNFNEKLNNYISQLPEDFDMCFIGDGCNLHIPTYIIKNSNTNIFLKDNEPSLWGGDGATRCTDSYLISNKCADKILSYISTMDKKINKNIDWWLNDIIRLLNFKVYWTEPTIVTQGTQNGLYTTSH